MASTSRTTFRPKARILQLLGDQLIRSPRLAVFELVKNAYDADATSVAVLLDGLNSSEAKIVISDNGEGMSLDTVRDIWFVPGHDHRKTQRKNRERTKRGRLPLGEKGVGRFAAHKLGNKIELVTRSKGSDEIVVEIDWSKLLEKDFLKDASITIHERTPSVFTGRKTGTQISVTELRDTKWSRGDLRRLYRDVTSICSPVEGPEEFSVTFSVPGRDHELEDIPDRDEILKRAIWRFKFSFDGTNFDWSYNFTPPPSLKKLKRRTKPSPKDATLLIPPKLLDTEDSSREKVAADTDIIRGIGPIEGEFLVYDWDRAITALGGEPQLIKRYVTENGGVRIYRDGVRVYNYGEDDDDWLGLDIRRVQTPTVRISRNIVLGTISLDLAESDLLQEKTNREGFVENEAFTRLRALVLGALSILETERKIDKEAIRKLTSKPVQREADKISRPIEVLRETARKNKVADQLEPSILKLEKNYNELRESMLQTGLSGLGLATVFHEIQYGVNALYKKIKSGASVDKIESDAKELVQLLNGISGLLRKSSKKVMGATELVAKVRAASLIRFRSHRIKLLSPLLDGEQDDFKVSVNSRLVVGAMTNLLDNSFYWMRARWPERPSSEDTSRRRLYIGRSDDYEEGPAIVIADTGPGFEDDPENLIEPFFTRRPEGMGLGLYYANLVMELSGGHLVFPEKGDVELPRGFDGAVLAMVFPEK